jgi:uncharacterized membrane protein
MMLIFAHIDDAGGATTGGLHRLWELLGAFHPLVVHFPIALLLTAAVLELFSVWKPESSGLHFAVTVNLILGTLGALVAAPLGWIDATQMHFEPDLRPVLAWHRWLGTSVAVGAALTSLARFWAIKSGSRRVLWTYRALLWLFALLLGITGHLGGFLVYGLDYFSP